VLAGLPTTGQSQNVNTACRNVGQQNPDFQIVDTIYTDFSQSAAVAEMNAALLRHPDTTIVASIYSELTKGAVQVLRQQNKKGVKVYDVGGDQSVLPLIDSGDVQMTTPYYPQTMGATAVQAIYDARVGRTPITRFYNQSGHPRPAMQGDAPLLAITRENLEQFKKSGLSEY
jgi:ABC-type sugar transport system substrate-binding protein